MVAHGVPAAAQDAQVVKDAQSSGTGSGEASPGAGVTLKEVVITALHQPEPLQTVPAAVTAISSDTLHAMGAKDYSDYLNAIPGVAYSDNGYRYNEVHIRGISDGVGTTDPLTAIYIDEAPITQNVNSGPTLDPVLYDVNRVEVLKGPQGTLYGASSMGGTVRIIMNQPVLNTFEGNVSGTLGRVYHGSEDYQTNGMVNIPLVRDHLALRLVGTDRRDGGFIDDILRDKSDVNDGRKYNGRAELLFQADADTSVFLSMDYQKETLGTLNESEIGLPLYDQAIVYAETGSTNAKLYGLTIRHDFGWANLVSASNYMTKLSTANIDATQSFAPILGLITGIAVPSNEGLGIPSIFDFSEFTQEIRLSSQGAHRLDWLVGTFYSDTKAVTTQFFDLGQAPVFSSILTGLDLYDATAGVKTGQLAGFGQLTYHLTERLSVAAGLRAFRYDTRNEANGNGILNGGATSELDRARDSSITQKYLVKLQATKDNMLYAQAVQGFRDGGANTIVPVSVCGADLAALGYAAAPRTYNPDTLWNYEVGSKNTLLDHRMQLDAAAYYIDWKNIQSTIGLPTCQFDFTTNGGSAVSKGVEIDSAIRPLSGLTLTGAVSYDDAKLTQAAPGTGLMAGDQLPLVSKWSADVSGEYEFPVGTGLDGYLRAGAAYVGTRWNEFQSLGPRAAEMPGYWLGNARFGLNSERWTAALFVTNLFNVKAVNFISTSGAPYDIVGEPRVIGVDGQVNF